MICEKPLSITVTSISGFQYFECEEIASDRLDSVDGGILVPAPTGAGSINRVAGKVNFAVQLDSPVSSQAFLDQTPATGLPYVAGAGMTLAGWFNAGSNPTDSSIGLGFTGASWTLAFAGVLDLGGTGFHLIGGDPFTVTSVPAPSLGAWHFFILELIPGLGVYQWEIDRTGVLTTQGSNQWPNGEVISLGFDVDTGPGSPGTAWLLDEIFFAPYLLTTAQKDYLWAGGAGRTMPIVLP